MKLLRLSVLCLIATASLPASSQQRENSCHGFRSYENPQEFFPGQLPSGAFGEVDVRQRKQALNELGSEDLKPIDRTRANLLAGGALFPVAEGGIKYYLLRGKRGTASGAFAVYLKGDEVLVQHGDLGSPGCQEMIDTALVVASSKTIRKVFFSFSMAQ